LSNYSESNALYFTSGLFGSRSLDSYDIGSGSFLSLLLQSSIIPETRVHPRISITTITPIVFKTFEDDNFELNPENKLFSKASEHCESFIFVILALKWVVAVIELKKKIIIRISIAILIKKAANWNAFLTSSKSSLELS